MFFVRLTFSTGVPELRSILQVLITEVILRKVMCTWIEFATYTELFQSYTSPTNIIYWKNKYSLFPQ
jgi:hypothetical protein